jgi:hypothetical protein
VNVGAKKGLSTNYIGNKLDETGGKVSKRKMLNYPILELGELLRDLRKDWRDLKYWDSVYTKRTKRRDLDAKTKEAIKGALRGIRLKKTITGKKILSVSIAIDLLKENNKKWGWGISSTPAQFVK